MTATKETEKILTGGEIVSGGPGTDWLVIDGRRFDCDQLADLASMQPIQDKGQVQDDIKRDGYSIKATKAYATDENGEPALVEYSFCYENGGNLEPVVTKVGTSAWPAELEEEEYEKNYEKARKRGQKVELFTGLLDDFYNFATLRLKLALSQWEKIHGYTSLDWYDLENIAKEKLEDKEDEIEDKLRDIRPGDLAGAVDTYEETFNAIFGDEDRLDNDYKIKQLFDEMEEKHQL